jgi:mono/diheme cytochrome c family protein
MKKTLLIIALGALWGCTYDNYEQATPALPPPCDTANVVYSQQVMGIFNKHCAGCHAGPAASSNIPLDSYPALRGMAEKGKLISAVTWDGNASNMPKGGNKLSECEISQLKKWVASGYPQ